MEIRFVLHRPKRSENIGAAARALANTGAGSLWVVDPVGFDRAAADKVATHGGRHFVETMHVVGTLDEALGDCVDVVATVGRAGDHAVRGALDPQQAAARLVADDDGPVALLFGEEQSGLRNVELHRAGAVATIPAAEKASYNLGQAVLVFAWEIHKARGASPLPRKREQPLADEKLLGIFRTRAREMLLQTGFLNPQQPDQVMDELLQVLRRARITRRETEMLLAVMHQLQRNTR